MGANRFATMSRQGAAKRATPGKKPAKAPSEKRRPLDDYETPDDKTAYLGQFAKFKGPIFEPAAGSGRMARMLKSMFKVSVTTADIQDGKDFLKRTKTFAGDIITNPPYGRGRGDAFLDHALELADGQVAMLMQGGFLFGDRRNRRLYANVKPSMIIVIPERVLFFKGKTQKKIEGQFFSNVWLVFPDRKTREKGNYQTVTVWPTPPERAPSTRKSKASEEFDFG